MTRALEPKQPTDMMAVGCHVEFMDGENICGKWILCIQVPVVKAVSADTRTDTEY